MVVAVALAENVVLVFCFFVFNVVLFVIWDLCKKRHILIFSKEIKGYKFYPVIGNIYHFIGENYFSGIQKVVEKYSLPCSIWIGHDYHYVTADAGEIKIVLNNPATFDKSTIYENFRTPFGNTLLMADVDHWKRNRKIFAKSFSQPILNGFVEIFSQKSYQLIDVLKESNTRDKFDIFERFSLDNFCANIMGVDLDVQGDPDDEVTGIMRRMQDAVGSRMFSSYFLPESVWAYTPEGRATLKDFFRLQEIVYEIIQKKRKAFLEDKGIRENRDKLPLMDMMLEAEGVRFTDDEIFREVFLFLVAATDTSGITLAFTFTLLGMNLEAQEKIYEEVTRNVGTEGPICYSDLPNLKYTERAIYESMRLLPVTPVLGRRATANVDIGTRIIPAGSNIEISVFNLHRSEEFWTNPLEYNPDRFLPEEVAKRHPYAFLPFSAGPRNCIGMKYAIMMMKTAVAHVIRSYYVRSKYRSVEDMKFKSCVTMKTVHDLDCKFAPRQN